MLKVFPPSKFDIIRKFNRPISIFKISFVLSVTKQRKNYVSVGAIATYELYLKQHKAHTVTISGHFDECNLLLLRVG